MKLGILLATLLLAVCQNGRADAINYLTDVFVETIAGSGFSGYLDGTNTQTFLDKPEVVVVDRATNVVFWDSRNSRLRSIDPAGIVRTLAGSGISRLVDGRGTNASFVGITSMTLLPDDDILISDNGSIRRLDNSGKVSTVLLNQNGGFKDGDLGTALFGGVLYLAAGPAGEVFVSDSNNRRVRRISTNGIVSTVAGSGNFAIVDGTGIFCSFVGPTFICIDRAGNLFVADGEHNNLIRKITPEGQVITVLGSVNAAIGASDDGVSADIRLGFIWGLICDSQSNLLFCNPHRVRRITPDLTAVTLAGGSVGYADGEGPTAMFNNPIGLAIGPSGMIYVADSVNNRIRRVRYGQVPTANALRISMYSGIAFSGEIGKTYRVEVLESLKQEAWRPLATVLMSSDPYLWFDPESAGRPHRFYRAVLLP